MTFMTQGTGSSDSVEWGTPDSLYRPLHALYDFTLDGAASHANAKVRRYCTAEGTFELRDLAEREYLAPETRQRISGDDGLNFPWRDERVFLNPPWGAAEDPCPPNCTKLRCGRRGWHCTVHTPGIEDFMRKARDESLRHRALVLVVFPARIDNSWFHDYVLPYARITWRRNRVNFDDPQAAERLAAGLKPRTGPPVGVGLALFR